jgi:hypothetical protein
MQHTNDPYESHCWQFSSFIFGKPEENEHDKLRVANEIQKRLHARSRVFCTSKTPESKPGKFSEKHLGRGYTNYPLWWHYAEEHKGICFAFHKTKLIESMNEKNVAHCFDSDVSYDLKSRRRLPAFNLKLSGVDKECMLTHILQHISDYKDVFFFSKDSTWKTENEYRLVVICNDDNQFEINLYDSMAGVILGSQFQDCYKSLIFGAQSEHTFNVAKIIYDDGMPFVSTLQTSLDKRNYFV